MDKFLHRLVNEKIVDRTENTLWERRADWGRMRGRLLDTRADFYTDGQFARQTDGLLDTEDDCETGADCNTYRQINWQTDRRINILEDWQTDGEIAGQTARGDLQKEEEIGSGKVI